MVIAKIVNHEGSLYQVIRELTNSYLTNKDGSLKKNRLDVWKEEYEIDVVLRAPTHFMLCKKIEDIDWEMAN